MSDYELVSGPGSPRFDCSGSWSTRWTSESSHGSPADRSLSSSTVAAHSITSCSSWAENARPLPPERSQLTLPNPISEHQQCSMPSITPKLSMRSISTPVNLLVCGASGCGKSSFISAFIKMLSSDNSPGSAGLGQEADKCAEPWRVSSCGSAADPHAVLLAGPDQFAAAVGPTPVLEAGRELLYKLHDCPGHGATIDPASYLEAMLTFLFHQQHKDFDQLHGSSCRGMPKSQVCGSLPHSITACLYFLPPAGPSKLDLVLMAGLSRHVELLPVVGRADSMTPAEAEYCCQLVQHMLAAPGEYVAGLKAIKTYGPEESCAPFLLSTRGSSPSVDGSSAGLCKLLALLTGDEVYGLLDHAWDMYTAFCSAHMGGSRSVAVLVAEACASATRAHLPSLKDLEEVKVWMTLVKKELAGERTRRRKVEGSLNGTSTLLLLLVLPLVLLLLLLVMT